MWAAIGAAIGLAAIIAKWYFGRKRTLRLEYLDKVMDEYKKREKARRVSRIDLSAIDSQRLDRLRVLLRGKNGSGDDTK